MSISPGDGHAIQVSFVANSLEHVNDGLKVNRAGEELS